MVFSTIQHLQIFTQIFTFRCDNISISILRLKFGHTTHTFLEPNLV